MSLIRDTELIQGDSSVIWKFGEKGGTVLDSNWTAKYSISKEGTEIIAEPLLKTQDETQFIFQIVPIVSETLEVGEKYQVAVEISNLTLNFRQEIAQFKLKILPQYVL